MITVELINERQKIAEYETQWRSLLKQGAYEISLSYEWSQALINTQLVKHDIMVLVALKEEKQIIGIIPLVIRKMKKYGISTIYLFPIAELFNTHSDLLLSHENPEVIDLFIKTLFKLEYKWDVFKINRLALANPVFKSMELALYRSPYRFEMKAEDPSFFITLGNNYDDYLRGRSDNFRKDIKKKVKRINALGCIEFRDHHAFDDVTTMYEQLISVECQSWKYTYGTSIASLERQQKLFKDLCQYAYKNGWLHLQFLYLDSLPIAYNLGLIRCNKYYYLKTSFDQRYAEVSPSTILRLKLIKELINGGITELDFTAEPYEWQRKWTNELRWHKSLLIYNNTPKARMYSMYKKLKSIMKDRNANDVTFRNPMDVVPQK